MALRSRYHRVQETRGSRRHIKLQLKVHVTIILHIAGISIT